MKTDPQEQAVTERMAPGVLSRDGFLGHDTRPLSEIIDADRSTLVGLGVTNEQIAGRLGQILRDAMAAQGTPVRVGEHLVATYQEAMGRIASPWSGEGVFAKGQVELTDERGGRGILCTPLSVHMIAEHGFYQGRGSRYRLEPELLCRMLGLGTQGG